MQGLPFLNDQTSTSYHEPQIQKYFTTSFFFIYFHQCGRKPQKFIAPVGLHGIFFHDIKNFSFCFVKKTICSRFKFAA